jgi:hypothetical protein
VGYSSTSFEANAWNLLPLKAAADNLFIWRLRKVFIPVVPLEGLWRPFNGVSLLVIDVIRFPLFVIIVLLIFMVGGNWLHLKPTIHKADPLLNISPAIRFQLSLLNGGAYLLILFVWEEVFYEVLPRLVSENLLVDGFVIFRLHIFLCLDGLYFFLIFMELRRHHFLMLSHQLLIMKVGNGRDATPLAPNYPWDL